MFDEREVNELSDLQVVDGDGFLQILTWILLREVWGYKV